MSTATLERLPPDVACPAFDRGGQQVGIVHFGLGAFARAHLAACCDDAMAAGERDWMICGVSLRSDNVARQMGPQDGLYTLSERSGQEVRTRVIGSVREVLVAGRDAQAIAARIASPACHIVSFTVTEKGYCRAADVALDLEAARASFYPLLATGMKLRMEAGLPGLTLLSCDNLPANGAVLRYLMTQYLTAQAPELLGWFAAECSCPNAMVDRIVPATRDADLAGLERRIGLRDEAAVFTESFSQWVVEDAFAGPRPRWEDCGVQIVADVAPFEAAKLRMLNGAHSLLAYAGLAAGHEFVHQAVADPALRALVQRLMLDEAAPTIAVAPAQDLAAYARRLLQRFSDPALNHRLAQIAMDGSQKIPQRWMETLRENSQPCPAILTGIAAWLWHISDGRWLDDPLADRLRDAAVEADLRSRIGAIFGPDGIIGGSWSPSAQDIVTIEQAHAHMGTAGEVR
nr:mannitol dehydrogenase family protein [Alteraurantiacibacter aestuarii]